MHRHLVPHTSNHHHPALHHRHGKTRLQRSAARHMEVMIHLVIAGCHIFSTCVR